MKNVFRVAIVIIALLTVDYLGSEFLKSNIEKSYGLQKHSDVLMVGHSHVMMGVYAPKISQEIRCSISKYTRAGVDLRARHLMVNQYLNSKYADSLKMVILGIDAQSFTGSGLSENAHVLFYPWLDNEEIARYVLNETSCCNYLFHKVFRLSRYNDELVGCAIRGMRGGEDINMKQKGMGEYEEYRDSKGANIELNALLMDELEQTVQELQSRDLEVILLQTPVVRHLLNGNEKEYKQVCAYFSSLEEKYDKVNYVNYTDSLMVDYGLFFNPTHLNQKGQSVFTEKIIPEIKKIYNQGQ